MKFVRLTKCHKRVSQSSLEVVARSTDNGNHNMEISIM